MHEEDRQQPTGARSHDRGGRLAASTQLARGSLGRTHARAHDHTHAFLLRPGGPRRTPRPRELEGGSTV
eukprot:15471977-Alexandrium_andersonii.AAC.1